MRILHITANSHHGGVSRYLSNLTQYSDTHFNTSSAIAGSPGTWHQLFVDQNTHWIEAPTNGSFLDIYKSANSIIQQIKHDPPDIIHTHYRKSTLVARLIQRKLNIPVLFTLHLTHIPISGIWRFLTSWGDHTHAPSIQAKNWILQHSKLSDSNITVVPHGIDTADFPLTSDDTKQQAKSSLNISPQTTLLAYAGRLEPSKNPNWLVDLAHTIKQQALDAHLIIQGDGPSIPEMQQAIQQHQLQSHITFLPYGSPLKLYQAADAVIIPSQIEGFSLMCLEAMSTGIPVIRTATAGAEEMIVEGQTGHATPIQKDAFIQCVTNAIKDKQQLKAMGIAAAEHVHKNLTLHQQVQRTIDMYNNVIQAYPNN